MCLQNMPQVEYCEKSTNVFWTDAGSLLLFSSCCPRLRLVRCHLLWCFGILTPPGIILLSFCLLLAGRRNLLGLGSGTEGFPAAPRHPLVRDLVRHSTLLCAAPFLPLPTRSAKSARLTLLASSPSMAPLLARSSRRWIWLQNRAYSGLVTFPARQRALASLTSLLVVAFCCCV